jgi:multiple sugar transport system substrate-binding protein
MGNGAKIFAAENPGSTVKAQFIGDWGVAIQKYAVSLAAGDIPDVGMVKRAWLAQLIPSGRIAPLDEILPQSFLDVFRRPIRESLSLNGHIYALPADGFCEVLFYNKSLLAEGPPTTWEELRTCAEALRPKLPQGAFPIGYMPFIEALWSAGGDVCSENRSGLDSPAALEALEFTLSLRDAKLTHNAFLQDPDAGLRLFLSGDAAMTVASSELLPEVIRASFPVGIAPLPGKNGPISAFSDNALVVFTQNAQAKRESILSLLDFLTRVSARTAGAASVREDIAATNTNPGLEQAFGVARNTPLTPSWGAIEFELARGLDLAARWRLEK